MASVIETAIRTTVTKGIEIVARFNRDRIEVDRPHPFLSGIHAPMSEELTLENLPVTGKIPAGLEGRYLRIGPNPAAPEPAGYHWFSGDGMVHGIALSSGEAKWYRNRWIRSHAVEAATGLEAAPGPRRAKFETVNTNVASIGGRTFALIEATSFPVELGDTLDEQAYNDFDGTLLGSFTAHPHKDSLTGDQHAITYQATDASKIHHVVISPEGRVVREEPITVQHGPSVHDSAITGRYVVILDLPVTFSMHTLIGGHTFPYRWNPDHQARVGLLPKDGQDKDVIWIDVDPCYVFHTANAFDLPDGRVVLDAIVYGTMFAGDFDGPNGQCLGLERWTIDPEGGTVERHTIDSTPQEFPRPDERRIGQPYRYIWTVGLPREDPAYLGQTFLLKHDLKRGTRETHDFGTGRVPGEFVFVAAHADAPEGEGWLIGLVVDVAQEATDLVILDAAKFNAPPVASIRLPHRVPPGFHGNWFANDQRAA